MHLLQVIKSIIKMLLKSLSHVQTIHIFFILRGFAHHRDNSDIKHNEQFL